MAPTGVEHPHLPRVPVHDQDAPVRESRPADDAGEP